MGPRSVGRASAMPGQCMLGALGMLSVSPSACMLGVAMHVACVAGQHVENVRALILNAFAPTRNVSGGGNGNINGNGGEAATAATAAATDTHTHVYAYILLIYTHTEHGAQTTDHRPCTFTVCLHVVSAHTCIR